MSRAEAVKRARGRPRDLTKIEAVLDAGWALFLERGVAAVPIEAIAERAKVSKGTLYTCFPDKSALFQAAVQREMNRIESAQGVTRGAPAEGPVAEILSRFGLGIMRFLASAPAVGFYNALSAELRVHPELARAFWNLGPGQTRANLAAILAAAAERGELVIDDPNEAADALFGLWQGFSNLQLALGLAPDNVDAWITSRVARGTALFLRAHATRPPDQAPRTTAMPKAPQVPPDDTRFQGFSPEAFQFFTELDAHQTREWFHANKARHERLVLEPLAQLLESLTSAFAAHDLPLLANPKTSVFRINRDVRFSKDKRPYKAHASAVLTRDGTKHSQGLIYLQLGPDTCFAAAGFYALEPEPLGAFRDHILRHPERWREVVAELHRSGQHLVRDDALVRLPRGYTSDQVGDLGDDIRLKSFVVSMPLDLCAVTSNELVEVVMNFALTSRPLLEFGWSALALC